jgi:signal transduction histidine kinase
MILLLLLFTAARAANDEPAYKDSQEYLTLRDSMHRAFNDGDSVRFEKAVYDLERYLLTQGDLHAYYTQRCNEIVFQLNRQHVFEAYRLATQLSKELAEKKLDKEMYMAVNMMGHIYRYSGNKESAKRCFWEVIRRMEQEGYTESLPPIYMNLVNIVIDENPQEALRLIDQALSIAHESSPERVFDIETRRTLAYYLMGDIPHFLEGYKSYKEGVSQGLSSVHGRRLDTYYLAQQGQIDEAIKMASASEDDPYETMADIYSDAGRWQEAYEALKKGAAESDSINSVILSASMEGIQNELKVYEAERRMDRMWFYGLIGISLLLLLLVVALVYIVQSRRRHLREIQKAYRRVLEADRVKTDFIQNVSHEVRTPLNIISGFAQVLATPDSEVSKEDRHNIASAMIHNTHLITTMIDEVLELSNDSFGEDGDKESSVKCNDALQRVVTDFLQKDDVPDGVLTVESKASGNLSLPYSGGQLRRILTPLLDNAYKNLPPTDGHIILRAHTTAVQLVVTVEDNGKGVPANEAEHIFERFVKLDTFKQGLGLGLSFSRTVARRLGGDVRLDTSYEGPGARFEVTLPL